MTTTTSYRNLSPDECEAFARQRCTATDWNRVQVETEMDPWPDPDRGRFCDVHFVGQVQISRQAGFVAVDGIEKPAGIYGACLVNCRIGRDVRIANVAVHIANYHIEAGACIEDVGRIQAGPDSAFGNGVEVAVLNEAGGRSVILFNELTSQFAHLWCLHRYRTGLSEKIAQIGRTYGAPMRGRPGSIGRNAQIASVKEIVDVHVGASAVVRGASRLVNGTILSNSDAPTVVGSDVHAEDFIISEGSCVSGGAMLAKTFVGQGCQVGKQFSSENSLFFANCEAFHGEAVSVFAGPYTVTHHKSTLLIAGLFSFYNAGSGTNQSNHMYKLGPVHEGKLERGTKTGSFAYLMWPCRVGPFSVVLGKHARHVDTADLPFSILDANSEGRCMLVPAINLTKVGTTRDGAKWPARDRRRGPIKRDHISFDVLSPYTVGRMLTGRAVLMDCQNRTDRQVQTVVINGAEVKRVLLRTGLKYYRYGIETYLLEKVVNRAEHALSEHKTLTEAFATATDACYSEDWLDIGGQLMPRGRLDDLVQAIMTGTLTRIEEFQRAVDQIAEAYEEDEWVWVKQTYARVFECDLGEVDETKLANLAEQLMTVKGKFLKLVLADGKKEFDDSMRTGFGLDGAPADAEKDFLAVRGTYEQDKFVAQMQDELSALEQKVEKFRKRL